MVNPQFFPVCLGHRTTERSGFIRIIGCGYFVINGLAVRNIGNCWGGAGVCAGAAGGVCDGCARRG